MRGAEQIITVLGKAGTVAPITPGVLTAATGIFILSGQSMAPVVDYRFPVGAGSFVLTGRAAALTKTTTGPPVRQAAAISAYLDTDGVTRSYSTIGGYAVTA